MYFPPKFFVIPEKFNSFMIQSSIEMLFEVLETFIFYEELFNDRFMVERHWYDNAYVRCRNLVDLHSTTKWPRKHLNLFWWATTLLVLCFLGADTDDHELPLPISPTITKNNQRVPDFFWRKPCAASPCGLIITTLSKDFLFPSQKELNSRKVILQSKRQSFPLVRSVLLRFQFCRAFICSRICWSSINSWMLVGWLDVLIG